MNLPDTVLREGGDTRIGLGAGDAQWYLLKTEVSVAVAVDVIVVVVVVVVVLFV